MSRRVSLLSWWPFYGYTGSESGSRVALFDSVPTFLVRFILFNIATFILWSFVHLYYETFLWVFAVKASQVFGPIPFSNPDVIDGIFFCRLENVTMRFKLISITVSVFITTPLLLSSSGISWFNRVKMILIGLIFLFLFQTLLLLIVLYTEVYKSYPLFLQKGVRLDQIITFSPTRVRIIFWLHHFFNKIFQFAVAVGIWIGLVSYYKRHKKQSWIQKLF